MTARAALPAHVLRKITVTHGGCWEWAGSLTDKGYGQTWHQGRWYRAHRLTYEMIVGPIPSDLVCDHLCRNRRCVNPAHIELVSSRENTMRGARPAAVNAAKTECPHGHPYSGDNLHVQPSSGKRYCRACSRERKARARSAS